MIEGMYLFLGVAVGIIGSLLGIGGGFILMPVFMWMLGMEHQLAAGTSLFVVLLNALSGSYAYISQKKAHLDAVVKFGLATIPGAIAGSYISHFLAGAQFNFIFGIYLICMAGLMLFKKVKSGEATSLPEGFSYNWPVGVAASIGVGFLSSIFGIGGGIIHVPLMIFVLGFPPHIATATSTCILAISAVGGIVSHFMLGHVVWQMGLEIGIGAVIGAQLGAKLSLYTKPRLLVKLLAGMIFCVGLKYLLGE